MRSIKKMIKRIGGETDKVKRQLGNLHELVQGHGSLADAVQATLTAGVFVQDDLSDLRGDIDSFSKDLQEFAESAKVSSEMVLGIIGRIREKGKSQHQEIKSQMKQLETVLGEIHRPPLPPPTQRTSSTSLLQGGASGIDGNTPLGVASVGVCETVITGNYLFGLIRYLQAKVDVLTKRSKNTGVIFQQVAFSSEAEFNYWYTALNSSGSGLAAFVYLVSIWTFASGDQVETSQWLNKIHCSKSVGLKGGNADAVYVNHHMHTILLCIWGSGNPHMCTNTRKMP
jgi:hypothetical protein